MRRRNQGRFRAGFGLASALFAVTATAATTAAASTPFTTFESGQVRPLAMTPAGNKLIAVNTPDNRIEIYGVGDKDLTPLSSVVVGLEPVAVAARTETEVWVVNHLSDSISIVDLSGPAPRVVRTLLVGDEPRDIVFAGKKRSRAFITTAHRGQNSPLDPQINTPGVGRADVWVFDADNLGGTLGGAPVTILSLFTDTPRALAVTPDGSTVYAAGFMTGNQTTLVSELLYPDELRVGPLTNISGIPQPKVGIMIKYKEGHWLDTIGQNWDSYVQFNLPDKDVFAIDAEADPPVQRDGGDGFFTSVGTVLYNMAVNPVTGKVYVSNTDARNDHRFEGTGVFAAANGFDTVRGHQNLNRVTVLDPYGPDRVTPIHLNKHIDYSTCCAPLPNDENAKSVAIPTGMAVSSDGQRLYVAALGSSKLAVYDTTALESDTFVPSTDDQIQLSGGGPTGLVLDEKRGQAFVLTRFDNSIKIIDTAQRAEVKGIAMYNPEPPVVKNGRRFLYDAAHTSSRGDSACGTCHVFGDFDSLTWDLGDPDNEPFDNLNPMVAASPFGAHEHPVFAPMKGPMNTQSLRGLANHGPMHWRGDRTAANDEPTSQPDSGAYNERANFIKFNVAFFGLIGRDTQLPPEEMAAFADFILQVTYPPNPNRNLDNSLTASQAEGRDIFLNRPIESTGNSCSTCHHLDPLGNEDLGVQAPGFFGTAGLSALVAFPQEMKVPHFRNLYQKVGMFGVPNPLLPLGPDFFVKPFDEIPGQNGFLGDQIRGFGFSRAGDIDSALRFASNFAFDTRGPFGPNPGGFPSNPDATTNEEGLRQKKTVIDFLMAFDTNLRPIVGQQTTLTRATASTVGDRIALLMARADAGDCDLVAKAFTGGVQRGYLYDAAGHFLSDRAGDGPLADATLRSIGTSNAISSVTYTCVPPGSGRRIGIDRDLDGILDGDDPTVN
jgi:DNA-binding beta-propeller fold protein YncE